MNDIKEQLCEYCHLTYVRGMVSAAGGNLSHYDHEKKIVTITAGGSTLRSITVEQMVEVDQYGNETALMEGIKSSKELKLHQEVYKMIDGVSWVFHLHPHYAIACSIGIKELPLVTVSTKLKLRNIPCAPFANPGSEELVKNINTALTSKADISGILLENHGIIAWGKTAEETYQTAELIEEAAHIYSIRKMTGILKYVE